ncbi:MAG: PKD domain-containing protein [Kineosporiaceae bacterium]
MTTERLRRSALALGAALATGAALIGPAQGAGAAVLPPVSIDAGADTTVLEGSAVSRSVVIVDGEDNGAPGWTYSVDYGDGSAAVTGATLTPGVALNHLYADGPALRTVTVSVTDDLGESASDSFLVSVSNVSPTPVLTGNAATTEGATYTLSVNGTDPAGVFDPLSYTPDWGDGTFTAQVFRPVGNASHVFLDDADGAVNATTRTITVSMIDDDGGFAGGTFPVVVNNVPPVIALSGAASVPVGTPYALTLGAITDPGRDTVTSRVIRWGDGGSDTVTAGGTVTHTYATSGSRTVAVDLTDEDGTFVGGTLAVTATLLAPTAPAGLTATALSKSSIRLDWTNTSATQASVVVERCKGTGCTSFSRVATLSGTAATYTSTGLSSRTTYTYRIRSSNTAGSSPYSGTASARTL